MLVEGCGGLSVSRPRTPSICGATDEGTSGAAALSYPVFPDDRWYLEIGVAKADWTWATVPETGRDSPVEEGVPTFRPSCCSADVTCLTVEVVGPNCCANCDGVRKWRYSGELGSEIACTSAASAAGSRGLRVTTSGRDVVAGAGPMSVAPGGTRPWWPGNLSRPVPAAADFDAAAAVEEVAAPMVAVDASARAMTSSPAGARRPHPPAR